MKLSETVTLMKLMPPNTVQFHQAERCTKRGHSAAPLFRGGFTIIELLVVIAIIGMLGSITFVQLTLGRAKARDAEREQEIKTLQSALALYVNTNQSYPPAAAVCLNGSDAVSIALVSGETLSGIPTDPQQNCPSNPDAVMPSTNYRYYRYISTDITAYTIHYYLETDTIPGKSMGVQQATP